jgi:HECT-domain (ubiquitin-transferase)
VPVTNRNREEYVLLYVQYILDLSIAPQFEAFQKGKHWTLNGTFILYRYAALCHNYSSLYCTVLCCAVLRYTVLCYAVLCYAVLCCTAIAEYVLHCSVPYLLLLPSPPLHRPNPIPHTL